jgi:hypothetical protein
MITIGVDAHKHIHAAAAINSMMPEKKLGSGRVPILNDVQK